MTTSEPSPRQARQALRWVIRRSAGPLPERQQRALQRWLQADPRHARAWRQQQAFWQRLDAAGPEVLAALPELTADQQGLRPIAPRRRLPWLLASAAAAVLMVAAAPHALLLARSDVRSSDAPRVVRLDDGSTAVLDAGTALAFTFDGQQRRVQLLRGQAWFQVAHEQRPFQVEAGGGQIRDIGTAFSVSMQGATITTEVSEGVVDVRPGDGSVQRLRAGQVRAFRDGRWLQPLQQAAPEAMAPWRRGEVVIDGLPAAQAIADLGRYRRAPVWVVGGQGARVRVSGLFHLQQPDTAIDAVAVQAGLRVQRLPGGALLVW
ncbi:histidine kinase [Stenotrophomonas maltophilia]|uniref:FecR family protein n=1 Tax=Stenotrophomonas maltophilia group TaxID=995085 RepID=UPI000DA96654|nr:FecR domain-containing protein [Stenotrophomonas maltophilia]PZT26729.1 histidine kinase [Stenotrophomonas maltophilia]